MSAWGRTGRVTLEGSANVAAAIRIDGNYAGSIAPIGGRLWAATCGDARDFPDTDHAIAWVLRRAAPDVWRAERPVVYSVARAVYGKESRWWVWSGHGWPKEDHGDHECIHPIVVRTFADAIYVANFNARSLARSRS